MTIAAIGIAVKVLRDQEEAERKKRTCKLKCNKCGAINEERVWNEYDDCCPNCDSMMFSTVWTGEHPNYTVVPELKTEEIDYQI
jgi:Zn finger protein HypA/HybF involved in hydrogenase expression